MEYINEFIFSLNFIKKQLVDMKKMIFLGFLISLPLLLLTCAPITETQKASLIPAVGEVEKELTNLSKVSPVLAKELRRLPELGRGLNERGLLALNRIVTFYTQSPNPHEVKQTFDRILSIGKKEYRKFSAPLQAMLWLAEGKEFPLNENPLIKYSQKKYRAFNKNLGEDEEVIGFVYNIWGNTYDSDKWKDPNEITDRLNSPHLFDLFFRDNIAYDYDKVTMVTRARRDVYQNWGLYLQSAKITIKKRKGICFDATNLAVEILTKAGFNVKSLQVKFTRPIIIGSNSHYVAVLEEGGLFYKIADDLFVKEGIVGPIKSINEIAEKVAASLNTPMASYSFSQFPMP